jgi:hypothetical protein
MSRRNSSARLRVKVRLPSLLRLPSLVRPSSLAAPLLRITGGRGSGTLLLTLAVCLVSFIGWFAGHYRAPRSVPPRPTSIPLSELGGPAPDVPQPAPIPALRAAASSRPSSRSKSAAPHEDVPAQTTTAPEPPPTLEPAPEPPPTLEPAPKTHSSPYLAPASKKK